MAEPGFMNDLSNSLQERMQQIRGIPQKLAYAAEPITERLKMLGTDPARFAQTGYDALKQQVAPQIAQAGVAGALAAGGGNASMMDPNARPGVPEEAMPADLAAMPPEQRQRSILQAILQRQQQRQGQAPMQ